MQDGTRLIIFTDLDGTLIDYHTNSFADASQALSLIEDNSIPLIVCSSKTAAEIEYHRRRLENHHPFISENGGGLFVPKGYFPFDLADVVTAGGEAPITLESDETYEIVRLGTRYAELRGVLEGLRRSGFPLRGFGDMSAVEVSALTGLPIEEAVLAKQREFDEPFVVDGDASEMAPIEKAIETSGFHCTTGRIKHLIGANDKGKAVSLLLSMYRAGEKGITTVAVGDAPNDVPMLRIVDYPVVVQQPDGSYHSDVDVEGLIKADGKGPLGWNRAITALLKRLAATGPKQSPL
ncbi:MAG TPA: mannosyl-3-phosphoglycerate phosphatase [Deltaproteobacteria bacterium]|nr:mannosyl-3-phosphoglycerate phosphatase [Deltaproteobacteria bacterium]